MNSERRTRCFLAALLLYVGLALPLRAAQPNIIFVLTDDLGWGDLGCFYQNGIAGTKKHATPNLDTFAAGGVQMRQHYCPAPVCAPSRASLLLGVHQGHANIRDNQFDQALEDNHTLATVLKEAGYATALVGKWGLQGGGGNPSAWPAYPTKRGFDYFYGYVRHADGHQHYPGNSYPAGNSGAHRSPKEVYENDTEVSAGLDKCYTTDLFTARTKRWIIDHVGAHPVQPFFVYLAYDTPHAALQVPTRAYPSGGGLTGGIQWIGTSNTMINTASGTIDTYRHPDYTGNGWTEAEERFATMVRRIDDCLGDLVGTLQDLSVDTNTFVVFSSDNGPHKESYLTGVSHTPSSFDSFGIFDGIKRDSWEGGIRVPTLARWPGTLQTGAILEQPSQFHDWLPTFAAAAGIVPPARTDGVSLLPMLTGMGTQRTPLTYVEYFNNSSTPSYAEFDPSHRGRKRNQMQAIFHESYKGVRYNVTAHSNDFEIYDLATDPQETNNLAAAMPALQQQMKDRVLQVRRPDGGAARPYDNEYVPPAGGTGSNGLNYAAFEGTWPWVPDFATLTAAATGRTASVDLSVRTRDDNVGILFNGYIEAPLSGEYTFYVISDAGAMLWVHEANIIDDDYNHDGSEVSGAIRLARGLHPIRIAYAHGTGAHDLDVRYSGPGIVKQAIPPGAFFVTATGTVTHSGDYVWGGAGSLDTPLEWDSASNADPSRWGTATAPNPALHSITIPSGGITQTDSLTVSATGSVTMTGGYLYIASKGINVNSPGTGGQFTLNGGHADAQWVTPNMAGSIEIVSGFLKARGANDPIAAGTTGHINFTGDTGVFKLPNKGSTYLTNKLAAGSIRIDGAIPAGVGAASAVNGRYFDNDVGTAFVLVREGSYREAVLAGTHPHGYYMLDEHDPADHVLDSSGRSNHGTDAHGVAFGAAGIEGTAATFDDGDYILLARAANPNGASFSVEMFVRFATLGVGNQNLLAQQDGTGTGRSLVLIDGAGALSSYYGGKTTAAGFSFGTDRWYHLVMTVEEDGATDAITFYINGEPTAAGGTTAGEAADGTWVLGAHKGLTQNHFRGLMDEVAIYDHDLSPTEVQAHFNASRLAPNGTTFTIR
jgi:arylsulfatase A-like enzyme